MTRLLYLGGLLLIAAVLLILIAAGAFAQFDTGLLAVAKRTRHYPAPTIIKPTGFSPMAATVPDTATGGSLIAILTVTMSDDSTFNGTCSDTDPANLTTIVSTTGGCILQVASGGYTSGNDGIYFLTINPCESGQCLNPSSPNFTLTISGPGPAPALAGCDPKNGGGPNDGSCFNTLALKMDFTGATPSSYNGTTFNIAPVSNLLDCTPVGGPPPSVIAIFIDNGYTGAYPTYCSDFSLVTDGSTQAFRMQLQTSDLNGNGAISIQTTNADTSSGIVFPTAGYIQFTFREGAEYDNPSTTCYGNPADCAGFESWGYNHSSGNYGEWDFIEMWCSSGCQASDSGGSYMGVPGDGQGDFQIDTHYGPLYSSGYSHEVYHTIGIRYTISQTSPISGTDGPTQSACFYVDGKQQLSVGGRQIGNCDVTVASDYAPYPYNLPPGYGTIPQTYALPRNLILSGGGAIGGYRPSVPLNSYVTNLQVWECAGWNAANTSRNGNACDGSVISSNP